MSDKSTPRPWVIRRFGVIVGGKEHKYIGGSALAQVALACMSEEVDTDECRDANAELICKAVNQYDHVAELIEAAKDYRTLVYSLMNVYGNKGAAAIASSMADDRLRSALDKMEVGQ